MLTWTLLWACNGDDPKDPGPECVAEVPYDGEDQDCDGSDLVDVDGDSHAAVAAGGEDCDDEDAAVHPDAEEVPYDGIDQDCADGDLVDVDQDEHAAIEAGGDDCDDADSTVHPGGNDDVGDGADQNCDGLDGVDSDADGFASLDSGGGDCADGEPTQNPDAAEIWYDGVDQNCDRVCDYDQDGDGAVLEGTEVANDTPCDQQPGPEVSAEQDCDDTDPLVTWVGVNETIPSNGEIQVHTTAAIYVFLFTGDEDPGLEVTLTDSAGTVVAGDLTSNVFTPAAPLSYLETYQLEVTHNCGTYYSSFTTEDVPTPVDPAGLVGRAYQVSFAEGTWLEPAGIGDLIASQLGEATSLVEVLAVGTDTLDLRLAGGLLDTQELCTPTTDLLGVDFTTNPEAVLEPETLSLWFDGIEVPLLEPRITGRFQSDSAAVTDVSLGGMIDTVPLGEVFGLGSDPAAICDLIASFGVSCVECPDGSSSYCMTLLIADVYGPEISTDLVVRTEDDVAADPSCP
jgi:hypothetical protein